MLATVIGLALLAGGVLSSPFMPWIKNPPTVDVVVSAIMTSFGILIVLRP